MTELTVILAFAAVMFGRIPSRCSGGNATTARDFV
jgi:hypothetical protein